MLWLSDLGGATDLLTIQKKNRESVQSDVERIRQEIASGKRHKVGSPEWMKDAGLVYDKNGIDVHRADEINNVVNQALAAGVEGEDISDDDSLEDRFKPRGQTLDDLLAKKFNPMEWVIPGLVAEGLGLIISPPKVGKSFLVLDLAVSVAAGVDFCGDLEVNQRPVLYLALEDGERRLQHRIVQLDKARMGMSYFEYLTEIEREKALGYVEEFIARYPKGLVIIDTLAMVMTYKRNGSTQYQHDHAMVSGYQAIAKRNPGSCILFVHHTRKSTDGDYVDSSSGTQGIVGAADFLMALSGKRGSGVAQLRVTGREVEDHSVTMKRDDKGFWLHDENAMEAPTPTEELSPKQQEILLALEAVYGGLTPKELQAMLEWENYNQVSNYLRKLMKEGHVRKSAGGKYVVSDA